MLSCETCYHGGPLEKIFITVISQSLLYNSYIIVVKTVWYSCVLCMGMLNNYMCNFVWACYKTHGDNCKLSGGFAHFLLG